MSDRLHAGFMMNRIPSASRATASRPGSVVSALTTTRASDSSSATPSRWMLPPTTTSGVLDMQPVSSGVREETCRRTRPALYRTRWPELSGARRSHMAARLPYLERDRVGPEMQAVYDGLQQSRGRVLNIFKLMAHH